MHFQVVIAAVNAGVVNIHAFKIYHEAFAEVGGIKL